MKRPLNARQERFCEFIATGENQTDAWIKAGYKTSRTAARRNASETMTKHDIRTRIAELRGPQTQAALLTKDEKRMFLRRIVESESEKMADRLRALELDAKLAGHFEPDKHVIDAGPDFLETMRERSLHIAKVLSLA